jgi:hypothetical protein
MTAWQPNTVRKRLGEWAFFQTLCRIENAGGVSKSPASFLGIEVKECCDVLECISGFFGRSWFFVDSTHPKRTRTDDG